MTEIVVYNQKMDEAPTLDDRKLKVGLEGFLEELRRCGWVDEENYAIKVFRITYEGHAEENNNYIRWTAILNNEK